MSAESCCGAPVTPVVLPTGLARCTDPRVLAPKVEQRLMACLDRLTTRGFDPELFETYRSPELQAHYYAQGRTAPGPIVTHVADAMRGWHFYRLAADVVSRAHGWDSPAFFDALGECAGLSGLDWGGSWHMRDLPHVQFGTLKPSPSDRARTLYLEGGIEAVWREVGAL